jgi:hypothetical protein
MNEKNLPLATYHSSYFRRAWSHGPLLLISVSVVIGVLLRVIPEEGEDLLFKHNHSTQRNVSVSSLFISCNPLKAFHA